MNVRQYDPSVIADAFAVPKDGVRHLGTGSFGETWHVRHADGTESAAKIIYGDQFSQERLDRETEGLRRIDDPRVVRLLEHSDVEIAGVTRPVLRFEYIGGGDVQHAITSGRTPSDTETTALLRGLLEAVHVLHQHNLVHRDIKPANIALRGGQWEHPVLLDFGLAKPLDWTSMTSYPNWMGTPAYMSPEQFEGVRARHATDLWATGLVVAEAATGRQPLLAAGPVPGHPG